MKERLQIKDLKTIIKDFKDIVTKTDDKGRPFLINGHNGNNKIDAIPLEGGGKFNQRYREAWANWLICASLKFSGIDAIFQESTTEGDGIIFNKDTKESFITEHVFANNFKDTRNKNEIIIERIYGKINKGEEYAKNKVLVVYFNDDGTWNGEEVYKKIKTKSCFENIYIIGQKYCDESGCSNYLTIVNKNSCTTLEVVVNVSFTDWKTSLIAQTV